MNIKDLLNVEFKYVSFKYTHISETSIRKIKKRIILTNYTD